MLGRATRPIPASGLRKLPYLSFRKGKGARIRLPNDPTSAEFLAAYQAALAGEPLTERGITRAEPYSIAALITSYKQSAEYKRLRDKTSKPERSNGPPMQSISTWARREPIDEWPRTHVTVINTAYGQLFTVDGYSRFMRDAITAAGLPMECQPHGLRKTLGRLLADAGATAHEIMAALGHTTLAKAERYTREADRKRGGKEAIAKLDRLGVRVS